MSISFVGQLSCLEAMGENTYTCYIVRTPALGCKKRFAPMLILWHHPFYLWTSEAMSCIPYGKERGRGYEGDFSSRRFDLGRACVACSRWSGHRCGALPSPSATWREYVQQYHIGSR